MSIDVRKCQYNNSPHLSMEAESPWDLINGNGWSVTAQDRINRSMSRGFGDGEWYDRNLNTRTGQQVLEKLLEPADCFWTNIQEKLAELTPPKNENAVFRQMKRKRKRVRADHGNDLNIHDVFQGRIDRAWTGTKFEDREVQDNKIIHLVVNSSLNGNIAAREAEWRTAATIAIYNELLRLNKSVAIYMVRTSHNCFTDQNANWINTFMVPIKKIGTTMSPKHLAAFCSATFTRMVMMYKYSNMIEGKTPTTGYGYATSEKCLPHSLRTLHDRGQRVIYVPHCFSLTQAKAAIETVIKEVKGDRK